MDKLYTWALALILVGVVLMAFGIVTRAQRKMLEGDLERFDAVVTKLKPVTKRYNYGDAVTLYAEYTVGEKLIEGYFYTSLPSKMFPYRPGDSIVIKLDPMHPTVFMIEDMENDPELERQYKSAPLVIGTGAAVLVIGVVLLILHIMK